MVYLESLIIVILCCIYVHFTEPLIGKCLFVTSNSGCIQSFVNILMPFSHQFRDSIQMPQIFIISYFDGYEKVYLSIALPTVFHLMRLCFLLFSELSLYGDGASVFSAQYFPIDAVEPT